LRLVCTQELGMRWRYKQCFINPASDKDKEKEKENTEENKDDDKDKKKDESREETHDDTFQAFAILAVSLIAMGEDIGAEMLLRQFNHLVCCSSSFTNLNAQHWHYRCIMGNP
jgi:hypothetical protein